VRTDHSCLGYSTPLCPCETYDQSLLVVLHDKSTEATEVGRSIPVVQLLPSRFVEWSRTVRSVMESPKVDPLTANRRCNCAVGGRNFPFLHQLKVVQSLRSVSSTIFRNCFAVSLPSSPRLSLSHSSWYNWSCDLVCSGLGASPV